VGGRRGGWLTLEHLEGAGDNGWNPPLGLVHPPKQEHKKRNYFNKCVHFCCCAERFYVPAGIRLGIFSVVLCALWYGCVPVSNSRRNKN
jgi:hypothetical protein